MKETFKKSVSQKDKVGIGLSLDKFADAKVSKYDKRKVLEQKRNEKLRRLSKFSKLKKKLEAEGKLVQSPDYHYDETLLTKNSELDSSIAKDAHKREDESKQKPKTAPSKLERLANKVENEKEEERRQHEEMLKERLQKEEQIRKAQAKRQQEKHNYLKRTKRGQPIMKYRIDKILSSLASS